jgi:hypothetical protein
MHALRFALVVLVCSAVWADVEILLRDGRLLKGTDVRREGDLYLLQHESGTVLPLPLALVMEVRLLETGPSPEPPPSVIDPTTGITYRREAATLAGSEERPPGLVPAGPQTLAGLDPVLRTEAEQLAALGPAASFRHGVIDPTWIPGSDWLEPDPEAALWSYVRWRQGAVDASWQPRSGWGTEDVLEGSRASWSVAPLDASWQPRSGF